MAEEKRSAFSRVAPVYEADGDGEIALFSGDLVVQVKGKGGPEVVPGRLILRLSPVTQLRCEAAVPYELLHLVHETTLIEVDCNASLVIDAGHGLEDRQFREIDHADSISAGNAERVVKYLVHVSGHLTGQFPLVMCQDGARQSRLDFQLLGWSLAMVPVRRGTPARLTEFSHVIEATPGPEAETLDRLLDWLFHLLGFVAGGEVGVAVVAGLDHAGDVAYATWGAPRMRQRAGVGWSVRQLVADALPLLAESATRLAQDGVRDPVARRAIDLLMSASGSEVLDVRVPVACSGIELLAWAILQQQGWATSEAVKNMSAGTMSRLLIRSSGIPVDIPPHFAALRARRASSGQVDWEGPEVLFNVRNDLVHPPRKLNRIAWPTETELLEAWQLATWYLELCILRLLDYQGDYWDRLRLGRPEYDVEPVPWAVEPAPP